MVELINYEFKAGGDMEIKNIVKYFVHKIQQAKKRTTRPSSSSLIVCCCFVVEGEIVLYQFQ